MNILVTGGAGFIGSVTVRNLLDRGYVVSVFDNLENGHRQAVDPRAKFFEVDLRRSESFEPVIKLGNFDVVIHFAGYIESGESMKNPLKFFETNFCVGVGLLKSLVKYGPQKIIFSSTAGVYGDGRPPFTEESPINPTSNYSLSKYFFEQALLAVSRSDGFQVVVLRYFNAAGAASDGSLGEAHQPETHLIPLVIGTALGNQKDLRIFGTDYPTADGTAVRDYVHVEDLSEAHILSLNKFITSSEKDSGFFEVYNVGTGQGHSNREVIEMVKKVSGKNFKITEGPRRAGDWAVSFAASDKIKKALSWQPRFGLQEIVESAYLWHERNPYGSSEK